MNNIKTIRTNTGLSQSKFAKEFKIPVRTLQQWEQGKSDPPIYVEEMLKRLIADPPFDIEAHRLPKMSSWKICIDDPFLNCNKIYPIQQRKVKEIIDDAKEDSSVQKIVIFGSSTRQDCHIGSDVDVYIEMSDDHNPITLMHNFEYDFWNNYRVDKRLKREILTHGIVVYE